MHTLLRSLLAALVVLGVGTFAGTASAQTAVSATRSTLTASPTSATANGTATITLTATARSATGATLRNVAATFAATGTGNIFSSVTATTNSKGVATVTLKSTTAETKTVSVTLGGIAVNQKPVVTFTAPPVPATITFSTQPKTGYTAGSAINVAVKATTSTGAAVAGVPVAISLVGGTAGAVLGGTLTAMTASTGIATFSNLSVTKAGTGYTLVATAEALTATSTAFAVAAGAASLGATGKSTIATAAGPFYAGGAGAPIIVTITDAYLNPKANTTVAFTTTGGTLSAASAVTNASGQATVTLTSAVAGTFSVTAKVGRSTVATALPVTFVANAATKLVVTSQPTSGIAGQSLTQIVISASNAANGAAPLPGPVTVSLLSGPPGAALTGTLTIAPATGATSVTFTGLSIQAAGASALRATSGAMSVDTTPITISPAGAAALVFTAQPSNVVAGALISPAVEVGVIDHFGNAVSTVADVTLTVSGSATLRGTIPQSTALGSATFGDLSIDLAGAGYILTASATGLTSATSASFDVAHGLASPDASTLVASPVSLTVGSLSTLTVTVRDALGNVIPTASVTFAATGTSNSLSATSALTDASGIASVTLTSTKAESKTVTATVDGAPLANSASVAFAPGTPAAAGSKLVASPTSAPDDGTPVELTATIGDTYGNPISGGTVTFSSSGTTTIIQPTMPTDASGLSKGAVSSTEPGPQAITATINASGVAFTGITFTAAPVDPDNSSVSVSPANVPADGSSPAVVSIALRDRLSRPRIGVSVSVNISIPATVTPASATTDNNGLCSLLVTADVAGKGVVSVTASGNAGTVAISNKPEITFTRPPWCVPSRIRFSNAGAPTEDPGAIAPGVGGARVADINNDGIQDLAVADRRGFVLIRLGSGAGTFEEPLKLITPQPPLRLTVADVTGDGYLDIVTANSTSFPIYPQVSSLSVFPGNGDGTFAERIDKSISNPWGLILVGDLNRDGVADIVLGNFVMLGSGDGAFYDPVASTSLGNSYAGVLADINGDSILDYIGLQYGTPYSIFVAFGVGDGTFSAPIATNISGYASDFVVGDLDADGRLDVAVAGYQSDNYTSLGRISLFHGLGNGAFSAPSEYDVGGNLSAIALSDLNDDGLPDVVAAGYAGTVSTSQLVVLRSSGVGSYKTPVTYAVTGNSSGLLAVADVTGDGQQDAITIDAYTGLPIVVPGRAGGEFPSPVQSIAVGRFGGPMAAADFNNDGNVDLIVGDATWATSTLLLGNGNGTFGSKFTLPLALSSAFVVADVDRDGNVDIVAANSWPFGVKIHYGNGDGSFEAPLELPSPEVLTVEVGDLDGDELPDLVMLARGGVVVVHRSGGGSQFSIQESYQTSVAFPGGMVAGDFNGDGRLDVAVFGDVYHYYYLTVMTASSDGRLGPEIQHSFNVIITGVADFDEDGFPDLLSGGYILKGNGDGSFQWPQPAAGPEGTAVAVAVALGDVDGDGHQDVVGVLRDEGVVSIAFGNGNLSFQSPINIATGPNPSQVVLADLNGDGRKDIVSIVSGPFSMGPDFAYQDHSRLDVLLLAEVNLIQRAWSYKAPFGPMKLIAADMNEDGKLDLVTVGDGGTYPGGIAIYLGKGDGTFGQRRSAGGGGSTFAIGDVNADGHLDVVTGSLYGSSKYLTVFLGNGDGTLTLPDPFSSPLPSIDVSEAQDFGLVDFDSDGNLDIVVAGTLGVQLYRGNGNGTFGPAQLVAESSGLSRLALGDVNSDGQVDVVAGGTSEELLVFLNNGLGGLMPPAAFVAPQGPLAIVIGDFNGDGMPDVAASFYGGYVNQGLKVLLGASGGNFLDGGYFPTGGSPWTLAVADVNGDGIVDVVAPQRDGMSIQILLGDKSSGLKPYGWSVPRNPLGVAVGDWNRDGHVDIAITVEQAVGWLHGMVPMIARCGP